MDLSKLTTSDKVIAGSGIVLFISSFLPWFKVDVFGVRSRQRLGRRVLLGRPSRAARPLVGRAIIATKMGDVKMPELPVPARPCSSPGPSRPRSSCSSSSSARTSPDRAWGLFLATIAALGLLGGGFMAFQEGDAPPAGGGSGSAPFLS